MKDDDTKRVLSQLFGDNRAEWPSTHFKDLFVEPSYQSKLVGRRPCLLVGGRGTGKTTALQSLRYQETFERLSAAGLGFADQGYLGILVRMNKNRVHAFQGGGIDEAQWARVFAHYFNLIVCLELAGLVDWLARMNSGHISTAEIDRITIELGIQGASDVGGLSERIKHSISMLQIATNNPRKLGGIDLSMAEAPLRAFADALNSAGLLGERVIFCCIDEYENLLDYQQAVVNTYVKHAEPPLSYKIGVRKNGLRNRQTLNRQDVLRDPDDFAEIEISDEGFELFAREVAHTRLRYARKRGGSVPEYLGDFLEELTVVEEAGLLGAENVSRAVVDELEFGHPDLADFFRNKEFDRAYFLRYWKEGGDQSIAELAKEWKNNPSVWETRYGNHGYASLFWLSKGRKGARIRKYYCGERTLFALAAGNIRYFLELIDGAISVELAVSGEFQGELKLSAKSQTVAAKEVGKRRLNQLEGIADHGVQLKRLVLTIGKVFFELARDPIGRSPEVNSFVLAGSGNDIKRLSELLSEGVGHLAFEVEARTKATSNNETKDDEYRLHRIFSAFFEISHRKKRRLTFDSKLLLSVLQGAPAAAISDLLESKSQSKHEELPEQLAFFSAFYEAEGEK